MNRSTSHAPTLRLRGLSGWPFTALRVSACLALVWCGFASAEEGAERPNIVLVLAEDISVELSCYGHPAVETPNIDALAADGVRYENAFCTAPSCTPSRNAMLTGVYQTRTDTQDQRRRGVRLLDGVRPFPAVLREGGYFTALGCGYSAKIDANFVDEVGFDGADWSERPDDRPFFAQITLGVTHRHPGVGWTEVSAVAADAVGPAEVELPPYFPDDEVCRTDWARYLDSIEAMDAQVGEIMARLRREQIADRTVVLFLGDNGQCHLRGKCWLYDPGIRVPLVAWYPDLKTGGVVDHRLVSTLDVTATILSLAGVAPPKVFEGTPLLGAGTAHRSEVFAARDLIDEVWDPIRCVRTARYKYIRNYRPENGYRECEYVRQNRPMLPVIESLGTRGLLSEAQRLVLAEEKPLEELYDLVEDPHELRSVADDSAYSAVLKDLRRRLDDWIASTGDTGLARYADRRGGTDD